MVKIRVYCRLRGLPGEQEGMVLGTKETPRWEITLSRLVIVRVGMLVFPNRFRKGEIDYKNAFSLNGILV